MHFVREKLTGSFNNEIQGHSWDSLDKAFKPVIYGATQELYKLLPEGYGARGLRGDLFMTPSKDLFYYLFSTSCDSVIAGAVCNSDQGKTDWTRFRNGIGKVFGSQDWQPDSYISEQFKLLREEAKPLSVSEWERRAAVMLQRRNLREMVKLISSKPSVSLPEIVGDRTPFEISEDVQLLEELGIITREFEIYCLQTQQKVSCVSNLAALEEASKRGFRCFHCGRSISEERVVQSLSITENGRRISAKNMWLAMLVGAALADQGVNPANILFRCEQNSEIVEVFADALGSLFMFSVSEDEITPDVAFRFLTRARFFDPQWSYLVSPVSIGQSSLRVIESIGERFSVVEGLSNLDNVISEGVKKAADHVIDDILKSFLPLTPIEVGNWASAYLLGEDKSVVSAQRQKVADSAPAEGAAIAEAAVEVSSPESVVEDVEPAGTVAQEKHAQEPEKEETLLKAEEHIAETVAAAEEPAPEIGDNEQTAKASEEERKTYLAINDITADILADLPMACENNDTESVSKLINSISELPGSSAMVADSTGQPFLGWLGTVNDSETVAAAQFDLMLAVNATVEELDLGQLRSVMICSDSDTLHVHASVDDYDLITHQKCSEVDAVPAPSKAGTRNLKKSLQSLNSLPGINGSMVFNENGEVVEQAGIAKAKALAAGFAKLATENVLSFCSDAACEPLRAFMVKTDRAFYFVLNLRSKGYLLCQLGAKAPAYVWRNDLSIEASDVLAYL